MYKGSSVTFIWNCVIAASNKHKIVVISHIAVIYHPIIKLSSHCLFIPSTFFFLAGKVCLALSNLNLDSKLCVSRSRTCHSLLERNEELWAGTNYVTAITTVTAVYFCCYQCKRHCSTFHALSHLILTTLWVGIIFITVLQIWNLRLSGIHSTI